MKTELGLEICPPPPPFTLSSKSGGRLGKSRLQTTEQFRNNICASQSPKQKPAYVNRRTRPPPPACLPPSTPQPEPECGCYGTDTKLICLQNQRYQKTARPTSPSQCFHNCSLYNTETCSHGNRQRIILPKLKNPYEHNYCDNNSVGSNSGYAESFHPPDSSGSGMRPNSTLRDDPSSLPAISPVFSERGGHDANKTYSSLLLAIQDLLSGSKDLRSNSFLDTETVLCEVVSQFRDHIQPKHQDNVQFNAQTNNDSNFNELDLNGNNCTLDDFAIGDSEDIIIPPPPDFAGIPLPSSSAVLNKNSNKKAFTQKPVPPSPSEWDSWNSDDDSLPVGEIPEEFQRLAQQFQQRKRIHSEYPIQQHLLNQSPEFQNYYDRNQQDSTIPPVCTRPESDLDLCMRCRHSPISEGDSIPKEIPQVPCEASIYSALNNAFRHDSNPRQISGISPTFQAVGLAGKEDLTDEFPNSKINDPEEQKRAQSPYHIFYHFPHHPDFLRTDKDAIIQIETKSQGNQADGRHLRKNKTTQTYHADVSLNQKTYQFQTKQTPQGHTDIYNQDFSDFAPHTSLFPPSSLEQAVQQLNMDASNCECKQPRLQEKDWNSIYLSTRNLQKLKNSIHSSHNDFDKDEDGILETLRQAITELANRDSGAAIAGTKCSNTSKNLPERMVYTVENFDLLDKNSNYCHNENWDTAQPSESESRTSVASSASSSSSSTQQEQTAREQANLPGEKQAKIFSGSDDEPKTGTNKPAIPVISPNKPQVPVFIPSMSSQSSSASTRSSTLQFPTHTAQAQSPLFPTHPSPYDFQFERNIALNRETRQLPEQIRSDFAKKDPMHGKSTSKAYRDFVGSSPSHSATLPPNFEAQTYSHNHGPWLKPWPAPNPYWLNGMTPYLIYPPSFPSDKIPKQATGNPTLRETWGYPCFVSPPPQGFTEALALSPHHFIGINNNIDFKTPISRVSPSAPPSRIPQKNNCVSNPGNISFTGMKLPLKRRITGQRKRN